MNTRLLLTTTLGCLMIGGCYLKIDKHDGEGSWPTEGAPCTDDDDCDDGLLCADAICTLDEGGAGTCATASTTPRVAGAQPMAGWAAAARAAPAKGAQHLPAWRISTAPLSRSAPPRAPASCRAASSSRRKPTVSNEPNARRSMRASTAAAVRAAAAKPASRAASARASSSFSARRSEGRRGSPDSELPATLPACPQGLHAAKPRQRD